MDTSKLGTGEQIAAGGALVLVIALFFPWYDVTVKGLGATGSATAWEAFGFIDILLLLVSVLVIGVVVAKAADALPALPVAPGQLVAAAGAIALLLILYRLVDAPGFDVPAVVSDAIDVTPKAGLFIGLIAAGALTFGGYRAMNDS